MASEWAEEADRQAQAMTRDLIECGRRKGYRVTYQKREARFALRTGTQMTYFSAHDYGQSEDMDWLQLRIDVFTAARPVRRRQRRLRDSRVGESPGLWHYLHSSTYPGSSRAFR
jgi:hypothetical protein